MTRTTIPFRPMQAVISILIAFAGLLIVAIVASR